MSLTRVTDNVVTEGSILPGKLSVGSPTWNSTGILSATGFVGDGSVLVGAGVQWANSTIISAITGLGYIDAYITAEGFVGDGSRLTNIIPPVSVIEVKDSSFTVTPFHNNCTVLLNTTSSINIDIQNTPFFTPGHTTRFVQISTGFGQFTSTSIFTKNSVFRTRSIYGKSFLTYHGITNDWTLYGNLSAPPTSFPIFDGFVLENDIFSYITLEDDSVLLLE